ncbi:MAG: dockerin type I repeat-containing protein [Clostridia bacterium]|nr:dockerin type I repeat-containing protein [Clostridia bacterium]
MKKAKRLLAVLLTAVMLMTSACLPSYAYIAEENDWHTPTDTNVHGYYLDYGQAAGYILDLLDELLADLNFYLTMDDLDKKLGIEIFEAQLGLNLDQRLYNAGIYPNNVNRVYGLETPNVDGEKGYLDLRNVDLAIRSLYAVGEALTGGNILIGAAGLALGDLLNKETGLGRLGGVVSLNYLRSNNDDILVLEHFITIVADALAPILRDILGGEFSVGPFLEGTFNDLLKDFLGPNAALDNIGGAVKDLLYSLLINSQADQINDGVDWDPNTDGVQTLSTLDAMVQKLVDWALIEGTNDTILGGGYSLLGAGHEELMPALADQPGAANLGAVAIQSDRDLDGALENNTMSFYQLVSNVLQALLGGMLTPMLSDLIVDAVGIEITEAYPFGDPSITSDMMYGMLLGSVTRDESGNLNSTAGVIENLLVSNGAPELEIEKYDSAELPADTPVGHVNAVIKWFLDDGGLDALIKIDYQGIHIQDNLMSLLNDIARLAVNLLPGLGLFAGGMDLAYTADELNEYWAYDADMNIVNGNDDAAIDALYLTYETEEIVYVDTYTENADGSKTPSIYCYYSDRSVVNTTNPDAADYMDPKMIRQHYVVTTDQVFACLIKMVLDDIIEGCYWPEWADTIPSVLAYGLAGLASPLLPENNYFARLDAYHKQMTARDGGDIYDSNGVNITPIPYTVDKEITIKDPAGSYTKTVSVPQAALDIGCSYLAAYLNTQLDLNDDEKLDTDTSLEKFAGEFLVWGFTNYLPMFTGQMNANGVLNAYYYSGEYNSETENQNHTIEKGVFMDAVNTYLCQTYSNFANRTPLNADDNADAYDAIYTLIDNTLFKLIPTSWLPDIHGSQQFVLDWLLGNLCEFDLQGILDLLTVNMDADAELNLPVIQVLLRVIDRVLALIVNDHSIILDIGRRPLTKTDGNGNYVYVAPSVDTLDKLLDCSSADAALPQLVYNLLIRINEFKRPLLATLLPLIFSAEYERPYDEEYLGNKGVAYYKSDDFEDYLSTYTDHVNATLFRKLDNEADAEAACDGNATVVRNDNGTYSIKLSNQTTLATYPDSASANSDLKLLKDAYYVAVESETEVDEEGNPVIEYHVYWRESYMTAAYNKSTLTDDAVPYGKEYYEYTDFNYASFYPRRAGASDFAYYGGEYQTFAPEDFSGREYYYTNADKALEKAQDYIGTYRSFATNDLPAAYGDWLMFSIETQLRTKDIWDSNHDGKSVMNDSDSDYAAATDSSNGYPVDGEPGMPSSMYPFSSPSTSVFSFYDNKTGETITSESMNMFNATNYEQIALALEYGSDPENNVELSVEDTESVVRLALYDAVDANGTKLEKNAIQFDITKNADNEYNGNLQWNTLSNSQLTTIATWLDNNGFTYEAVLDEAGNATGDYKIFRPAFKLIDESFSISTPNIGLVSTPALPEAEELTTIRYKRGLETKSDYEKAYVALHNAYKDYITALYQNRRSLYNLVDEVSYRYEEAEAVRSIPMQNAGDIIVLDWAIDYAKKNYYLFDAGRNYRYTGELVNGQPEVSKVYTSTSFAYLQEAYDYAVSLRKKVVSNAAVSNEITQSMVTAAYQGILAAIRKLVEFTGFADWTQLDRYIEMATEILNDPNKNDPILGYASGLDVLEEVLEDSILLRSDSTIDCESQETRVDPQAAALNEAIQSLVFNTIPSILPTEEAGSVDSIAVSNVNNRLVGHIFGLAEGTGMNSTMVDDDGTLTIAGITIDKEIGNEVNFSPTGRGNGTGSYFSGRIRTIERFRYYAVVYGDLNGDTRIDGSDAAYVQYQIAKGKNTEADMDHFMFVAADANHDNVVDAADIVAIQNHYTYADTNGDGVVNDDDKISQIEHREENIQ